MKRRLDLLALWLLLVMACTQAHAQENDPNHIRDVIYTHKVGVALTMDVFKPAKPNGIGVIWMVSGGWLSNHESIDPGLAQFFTSRGDTVFEVVHGSQPKFTIPEIVKDIQRAVRFIRFHAADYGVDPNRLGISGGSAGGHLSLMTGADVPEPKADAKDPVDRVSSAVQAVACFFPPTDFLNYGKEGASAMKIDTLKGYWPAFGMTNKTPPDEAEKIARLVSPMTYVSAKMPPTLIIHGDADPLVPIQQSRIFIAKLDTLKVPHKLEVRPGKGHGWVGIEKDLPLFADWFDKYLVKTAR
jgi:acetyl esterase/lipase